MSKCGKGCMPECEYFTTSGCISPFNCPYKIETGYINSATSTPDSLTDLLIEFDEMGFAPTTPCPNSEEYAIGWRGKVRKEIERLKSENAELKSSLTHANEECLKWHERAQNLLKYSGGSISGYEKKISDLQAENAALKERLKKAVGLPVKIGDTVYCVDDEDCHYVVETTTVTQENFYLLCSRIKGNPSNAFLSREAAEAWLKELQGGEE